jgi:hypothetical protein
MLVENFDQLNTDAGIAAGYNVDLAYGRVKRECTIGGLRRDLPV